MTTPKMTRKRALDIAQKCIIVRMNDVYDVNGKNEEYYAELAAALAYIEHMARQKEMEL